MTDYDFKKLMTRLTQRSDWPEACDQFLAENKSNDPRLNALLDLFAQVKPETPGESRLLLYLLFATMKLMALDHFDQLKDYTVQKSV